MKNLTIISGAFDPLTSKSLDIIKKIREKSDIIVICLNSDNYILNELDRKPCLKFDERYEILKSLKYIDFIFAFDDSNTLSIDGIKKVLEFFNKNPIKKCTLIGDGEIYSEENDDVKFQFYKTTPIISKEKSFCIENNIEIFE